MELSGEIAISLSFTKSACVATRVGEKTAFVVKALPGELDAFREADSILCRFERLERSEFPYLRVSFKVQDRVQEPHLVECFFSMDSSEEMELLDMLRNQDEFDMHFFDSNLGYRYSKHIRIISTVNGFG